MSMPDFPPALPHGPITEVYPGVFSVTGSFRFAPGLSITRNMVIVRQGEGLVLVNSVRLTPAGEAELERLGRVEHLVRIGTFHGADDPWFVHRYAPAYWAPPGMPPREGAAPPRDLRPDSCPIDGATVFSFTHGRKAEVALILPVAGGVLVTCDSFQNWTTFEGCSFLGGLMMRAMGFGPTLIGGPWLKEMGRDVKTDFEALLALEFAHLAPAHGTPIRDRAKDGLRTAMAARFRS